MRSVIGVFVVGLAGACVGCSGGGSDLDVAPVSGTVTYNGSPLAGATVTFMPESGPIAAGVTDLEGTYELRTGTQIGAIPGEHRVSVQAIVGSDAPDEPTLDTADVGSADYGEMMENMSEGMAEETPQSVIPERYSSSETSGLTFTVSSDDNVIDIPLVD